uniref:Uncharacterized protein n=1 Tax=Avena sativa TaxID=4498 RepID=A0ACD5TE25_AVESA
MPTGRGRNQETTLCRPGDTRWGSHYTTLSRIESMWDAVIEVLGIVEDDSRNPTKAGGYVHKMETFSFVFMMKMMLKLLRMTNDVSLLLQKKDQNIVQAMSLVTDVRTRLVNWRNNGWEQLLEDVKSFCTENEITIPMATATVERAFSAMKIIKTELRNKMSDGWLNDLMVCYIERGIFKSLDLGEIKKDFQKEGRALPLPGTSRRH